MHSLQHIAAFPRIAVIDKGFAARIERGEETIFQQIPQQN
jgi:hypothetical protein